MKRENITVLEQSHLKLSKLAASQYYYQEVIIEGIKHSLFSEYQFKMSSASDISSPSDVSSEGEEGDVEGVGVGTTGKITKIQALYGQFPTNARIYRRVRIYTGDLGTLFQVRNNAIFHKCLCIRACPYL